MGLEGFVSFISLSFSSFSKEEMKGVQLCSATQCIDVLFYGDSSFFLSQDIMMNIRLTYGLYRSSHQPSTGKLPLSLSLPHAHPSWLFPIPNITTSQVRRVPSHGVVAYNRPIPRPHPSLLPTSRHSLWSHIHRNMYRRSYPPRLPSAPIPGCGWEVSEISASDRAGTGWDVKGRH